MTRRPEFQTYTVDGTELGALRWAGIDGAPTVVAVHGITANAWSWDPVAHHLSGGAHLVAVDLRGRGRSFEAPGPFGIRRHADDIAEVIRQIGDPCIVAGHSMGAFVALLVAERHPSLVHQIVLVDGGTPLPVPDDIDADEFLDQSLGPAIERLQKVWADRTSYYAMWASHPAFSDGISIDLERNLLADLIESEDGFRTAVDEAAVRFDGRELIGDAEIREALMRRADPTPIIRAPLGLLGAPPPLISDDVVEIFSRHRWIDVPDTNHYTVLMGPTGAAVVADTLRSQLSAPR